MAAFARRKNRVKAVAYLRTSSAANVGADKDSETRQRGASNPTRSAPASWSSTATTTPPFRAPTRLRPGRASQRS